MLLRKNIDVKGFLCPCNAGRGQRIMPATERSAFRNVASAQDQ